MRLGVVVGAGVAVVILSIVIVLYTPSRSELIPEPTRGVEYVASRLNVPWSIDVDGSGRLFFTERIGNVKMIDTDGMIHTLFSKDVADVGEGGMLGIALDPDFDLNGYIYIYYTYSEGGLFNRVSRIEKDSNGIYSIEHILIDRIPAAEIHNGGRIKFGPDGRLYVATGDANQPMLAQDINSLAGKILRLNKDGSIPEDNPFHNSYIYSYGHRNVQGLAWGSDGTMYATEHGPVANDEINIINAGANYGWPHERCSEAKLYEQSLLCYAVSIAPSGATFITEGNYKDRLLFATLRGERVEMVTFESGRVVKMENFLSGLGRIRDVLYNDGYIYIATSNRDGRGIPSAEDDRIVRVRIG